MKFLAVALVLAFLVSADTASGALIFIMSYCIIILIRVRRGARKKMPDENLASAMPLYCFEGRGHAKRPLLG